VLLAAATSGAPLKVQATLVELPSAPRCGERLVQVTARYRVDHVLSGAFSGPSMLVVHRCPEHHRGPSRIGRGQAGALRPGQVHLLILQPMTDLRGVVDRFSDDPRPRYQAMVTDPGPKHPRIAVVVSGGAGASHRLNFDRARVSVGRSYGDDVVLADPRISRDHLRLSVQGEYIMVEPQRPVLLNGRALSAPHRITFKDRIRLGSYTIKAALFMPTGDPA